MPKKVMDVSIISSGIPKSGRMHSIMERNSTHFDDLIRLAAPAKDMREFERKPDRMA